MHPDPLGRGALLRGSGYRRQSRRLPCAGRADAGGGGLSRGAGAGDGGVGGFRACLDGDEVDEAAGPLGALRGVMHFTSESRSFFDWVFNGRQGVAR